MTEEWTIGAADASVVERDNPEVRRQPFDLSLESIAGTAQAANQQHRLALAVEFVVGAESRCLNHWQDIALPRAGS